MNKAAKAVYISAGGFVLLLLLTASLHTSAEPPARLNHISGKAYILKASKAHEEEAAVNTPIGVGDRLSTTDGRAEIYLHRGKFIRLDHNTRVDFMKLPDDKNDTIQLRILSGSVYLDMDWLNGEKSFEVHTADLSLYILEKGTYRVDVRKSMETEVFVFEGLLEASLDTGAFLIKDEQRIEAIDGHSTSRPSGFIVATEDSFDHWNHDRALTLGKKF